MMIGWGGVHSDLSSKFKLRLLRAHRNSRPIYSIEEEISKKSQTNVKTALENIAKRINGDGVYVMTKLNQVGPPGWGNHYGGSLPMKNKPNDWNETDKWGSPKSFQRLNIIDASVLPSVPATTMALTIMANAYRITKNTYAN